MSTVYKFWSLNLLEPQEPVQACSGKALPLPSLPKFGYICVCYASFLPELKAALPFPTKSFVDSGTKDSKYSCLQLYNHRSLHGPNECRTRVLMVFRWGWGNYVFRLTACLGLLTSQPHLPSTCYLSQY